jgi:hypothetical protein
VKKPEQYVYFTEAERTIVAQILARLCILMDPGIDDWEAEEIIAEFIAENDLGTMNVNELAMLIKTTVYDPKRDGLLH